MLWQREDLNVRHIEHETERAVLIRIPDLGYKGYIFWESKKKKKFVRKIKNVSERVRVIYPCILML